MYHSVMMKQSIIMLRVPKSAVFGTPHTMDVYTMHDESIACIDH